MVASNPVVGTDKSRRRSTMRGVAPIAVQIACRSGADGGLARYNVQRGAQIIDINMGCPRRRSANGAGSALLANERWSADFDAVARGRRSGHALLRTGPNPTPQCRAGRAHRRASWRAALRCIGRTRPHVVGGGVRNDRGSEGAVGIPGSPTATSTRPSVRARSWRDRRRW
jgi:hypothetical protein